MQQIRFDIDFSRLEDLTTGRFLWVVFQLDEICNETNDAGILKALQDLPKNLSLTFDRILQKLVSRAGIEESLRQKIFEITTAAYRPISLEELREAINVKIGQTTWDSRELINDMSRLIASCGSFLVVEEETGTVHFAHHSVKHHLMCSRTGADSSTHCIDLQQADLNLGKICVTYLSLGIFEKQLTKARQVQQFDYPSHILKSSFPDDSTINRLASRLLKKRLGAGYDISHQLERVGNKYMQKKVDSHAFLVYAQSFWLQHTKLLSRNDHKTYRLWKNLLTSEADTVKFSSLPCAKWSELDPSCLEWTIQNGHDALFSRILEMIQTLGKSGQALGYEDLYHVYLKLQSQVRSLTSKYRGYLLALALVFDEYLLAVELFYKGVEIDIKGPLCREALQRASLNGNTKVIELLLSNGELDGSGEYEGSALEAASLIKRPIDKNAMIDLLIDKGANVNAQGGCYGNALQAATLDGGGTAELLLRRGANVNAQGGYYGTALQAAACNIKARLVRLFLKNGADPNIQGGYYGSVLQAAACFSVNEAMVRLLLKYGANVNAQGGHHGNALQAAASHGGKGIVLLLLENGADVNAQGGEYCSAAQAAYENGHSTTLLYLLDHGAIPDPSWGELTKATKK